MPYLASIGMLACCGDARAQHDGHREAVIDIAAGRMDKAEDRLDRLFEDPATLWRGLQGPYARAGAMVRESGDGYRQLVAPETHFTMAMLHSLSGDVEKSMLHAKAAVEGGVPFERLLAGPPEGFGALHAHDAFRQWADEQAVALIHGPMLGNVTHDAASFWVRTAGERDVEIRVETPGGGIRTARGRSRADADRTAVVRVEGLRPGEVHRYSVNIDGQPVAVAAPEFRTHPQPGAGSRFSVTFTACAGYAPEHERVWLTIKRRDPLALLMLGDNVYIDDPEHSLTQRFCYYRRFSRPEWRSLVSGRGVYAIWDDHDFGDDDSFGGPETDTPPWKRQVWNVFTENWNNPAYGGGAERPGVWFDFHIGDVHFIMLDGRYYREPNGRFPRHPPQSEHPSMLGPAQLAWLKETLRASVATFKVIASPVPWADGTATGQSRLDKWEGFPAERQAIFDFLHEHDVHGVVLISGDRHRSDARRIERQNGYALHDFMSAIPTNYHTHPIVAGPGHLFGHNAKNSFGMLHFDTTAADPQVTCEFICIDNETLWTHTLRLSELRN